MKKKIFNVFTEYKISGFGSKADVHADKLLNKDGSVNVSKKGMGFFDHFSIFHFLVTTNWFVFNTLVTISYLAIIFLFGFLYWKIGIENLGVHTNNNWEDFLESIYFSAQTFSTVGYGRANPGNHLSNIIAVMEMLFGMMYLALAAGLLFARFSRPVGKIVFSDNLLFAPYNQGVGLMFRLANAKSNLLIDVEARILLNMRVVENREKKNKFYQLPLEISKINMLALSWTVVHPIDDNSPLAGMSKEELQHSEMEFIIMISGSNNTFSQNIHTRYSYTFRDIIWGAKFLPMYRKHKNKTILEINKINHKEIIEDLQFG